jgi:4'-phosphopantetheinyl transferase
MPALRSDEVHVWRARLDLVPTGPRSGQPELSSDEIARASQFVLERDRDRFVAGRRILREILGGYLQRAPEKIDFTYNPHGKPQLRFNDSDPPIRFNLAHSDGLAVYAISLNREIGVDIEMVRDRVSTGEIADHFFTQMEISEFRALTKDKQNEGFFLWWSRKEAYLKALGAGLSIPLDSFDVSLTPGTPMVLRSSDSTRWTVRSFQPRIGYVGALVVEGAPFELKLWDYAASGDVGS